MPNENLSNEKSRHSAKPKSMAKADTTNGEAPEPVDHPTGSRQAENNRESDPPA